MQLSVIVPVYNVEKYLLKCVDSILEQTFNDFELILVDDGSTDNSGKLCDELINKDKRIKVIHKKNGGLSSARNSGLAKATGKYVSFIDSDDFIDSNMYETMIEALERTHKDVASCGRIVDLWGKREKVEFSIKCEKQYSREEAIKEILMLREIDVAAWDKVYRRCLFHKIKYPEGQISEDSAIIFELIGITNGVVHVGKPFYHYIYRKNSISKSSYSHKYYDAYINCINTQKLILQNYPNMIRECRIYCTQVCGALLQCMFENKNTVREYQKDFDEYKALFNKGFWDVFWTKDILIKKKIKWLLVYFNMYNYFLKVTKKI